MHLLIELHEKPSQLVSFSSGGPGCLVTQAMLENWLQVSRVDGLQLLSVRITKGMVKEEEKVWRRKGNWFNMRGKW